MARDYNNILLGLRDPALRSTVRHALADFDGLSKDEQLQADAWLAAMFLQGQTLFFLDRWGLAGELSGSFVRAFASFLRSPGLTQWWTWAKELFDPESVTHIEAVATSPNAPRPIQEVLPWYSADAPETR